MKILEKFCVQLLFNVTLTIAVLPGTLEQVKFLKINYRLCKIKLLDSY